MNLLSVKSMIYQLKTRFCILILLNCFVTVSYAAKPDSSYFEVWELKSLKKIGGHQVQVFGDPEIVKTDMGRAIKFDGIDDRLLVDNNPLGDTKEFTIEVIFKADPAYDISNQPRIEKTLIDRLIIYYEILPINIFAFNCKNLCYSNSWDCSINKTISVSEYHGLKRSWYYE